MNKNKSIFVTSENLNLRTGGVMYANNIINGIKNYNDDLIVFSVDNNCEKLSISRSFFRDIISRVFLQSSVSWLSFRKIIKYINNGDDVYIHSGKEWFLIVLIKSFRKNVKVVCVSDNIEYDIFNINSQNTLSNKLRFRIEKKLRYLSELVSYRLSDNVTFITNDDYVRAKELYKLNIDEFIIPITVNDRNNDFNFKSFTVGLFTGSFLFSPNIEVLNNLINLFEEFKVRNIKVIIAGYNLDNVIDNSLKEKLKDVFLFFSSPSEKEMDHFFSIVDFYLSPVTSGSGMKTKVAEALSYGLPIIATKHSLVGYQNTLKNVSDWVFLLNDDSSNLFYTIDKLRKSNFSYDDFIKIKNNQKKFYSTNTLIQSFKKLKK